MVLDETVLHIGEIAAIIILFVAGMNTTPREFMRLGGCGLPAMLFLKDRRKSMKVGIGMVSRGEVGLIVAAAGASAGVLSCNHYTTVVIMVAVSTIITPVWLKMAYKKDPLEPAAAVGKETK